MTVAPISGGHLTFSCTNDRSVEMAGDQVMLLYMYTATHGKYLVTSARVLDLSNLRKCLPLANRSALKNRRDIPKQQQQRSQRARCFTIVCFEGTSLDVSVFPSLVQARSLMCYMLCGTRLFQQSMRNTLANMMIFIQLKRIEDNMELTTAAKGAWHPHDQRCRSIAPMFSSVAQSALLPPLYS
jgi:hypothetical protein